MNEEYHKPFLKSLIFAGCLTIGFMIFSHYVIRYYKDSLVPSPVKVEYSSQHK
jgi:hypothetical protein